VSETSLRPGRSGESLGAAPVGIVPIIWNNADLTDLAPRVPAETVLDEVARLGFAGTTLGIGFPSGAALRAELDRRGLRLAEVYATLGCNADGPTRDGLEAVRHGLAELQAGGGEVLVVAIGGSPEREAATGRAASGPTLEDGGWRSLAGALEALGRQAHAVGRRLAVHNHAGGWIETPEELERLASETDPRLVELCLDTGHFIVGGGDPDEALRRYGQRVIHVHLKDVSPRPLEALREGRTGGFDEALRQRIFAPLGSGVLDLPAVLRTLAARRYRGWLMIEQDTSWEPPSEASAIGRRVLDAALRWLREAAADAAA
jgi:inosose dehydratase